MNSDDAATPTVGKYLAEIWVRPKWTDGRKVIDAACISPAHRLDLTRDVQIAGRGAGALLSDALAHEPTGWESGLLALIQGEASFRGLDQESIGVLTWLVEWWVRGDLPAIWLARYEWDPASVDATWLGAAIIARWAVSLSGLTDDEVYGADVGDLVEIALTSDDPEIGLVTPATTKAGVGTLQMIYAPELVVGFTVVQHMKPQPPATRPPTTTKHRSCEA